MSHELKTFFNGIASNADCRLPSSSHLIVTKGEGEQGEEERRDGKGITARAHSLSPRQSKQYREREMKMRQVDSGKYKCAESLRLHKLPSLPSREKDFPPSSLITVVPSHAEPSAAQSSASSSKRHLINKANRSNFENNTGRNVSSHPDHWHTSSTWPLYSSSG